MENLSEEFKKINELKGECMAIQAMFAALWRVLPNETLVKLVKEFEDVAKDAKGTIQTSGNVPTELAQSFDHISDFMKSEIERVVTTR